MSDPIRVLLVDDQKLFRSGVAVTLGAEPDLEIVGEASNGREAVRLVDETRADVVLMDIRMPELDGVEATRQIFAPDAAARRDRQVRVIVLTTFNLDDRAARAIRYGASGFLLKDTSPASLGAAIRTVHAGAGVIGPGELSTLLSATMHESSAPPAEYDTLTDKEREILAELARGLSNAEIASALFLSESTIKTHVGSILRKLGLRDRVQVVVFAYEHGLTPPRDTRLDTPR
jgi:DNA-binding NarL/FixJ family response regulator